MEEICKWDNGAIWGDYNAAGEPVISFTLHDGQAPSKFTYEIRVDADTKLIAIKSRSQHNGSVGFKVYRKLWQQMGVLNP